MEQREQQRQLGILISVLIRQDPVILTAALSLLPEHSHELGYSVIQAAAHIGASHFQDREAFLDSFRSLMNQARDAIDEADKLEGK